MDGDGGLTMVFGTSEGGRRREEGEEGKAVSSIERTGDYGSFQ